MSLSRPPVAEPTAVDEILTAAAGRGGDRLLLLRVLELLTRQFDLAAAAVYGRAGKRLELQAAVGAASFPATLGRRQPTRFESLALPGGRLLYEAGGGPPPGGSLLLALAAAQRAATLHGRLRRRSFEASYRGVELQALYDVGLAIASTLDPERLGEEILLRAVSLLDARRGALYLLRDGEYVLQETFGGAAPARLDPGELLGTPAGDGEPGASGPGGSEVGDGASPAAETREPDRLLLPGAGHVLQVAIEADGRPRGLLVVGDKESRTGVGPFGSADRRTLSLLANQAAIALENARLHSEALEKERLERELELAAEIQRRLLPERPPVVEGFELAGWSRPAQHVGGDYYDLLRSPEGRVLTVLADVAGKGLPAALMVSTVHAGIRLLADRAPLGPELAGRLNQHLAEATAPNKFVTLLAAELDPARAELRFVNAGHNPGLLLRAGGAVEELPVGGLPLGIFAGSAYQAGSVALAPGDLLCMYSDGITECVSPDGEEFGVGRLKERLGAAAERPLGEVVETVERAVTGFACGRSQADDQTLVLLRRQG